MFTKSCVTAGVLLLLAHSSVVRGQEACDVFDQFADAVESGVFQGLYLSDKLTMESVGDDRGTQGVNVVHGYTFGGKIVQQAVIEEDVSLVLSYGKDSVQGINVYRGGAAEQIKQVAIVDGTVKMSSRGHEDGIQGINVVTGIGCD